MALSAMIRQHYYFDPWTVAGGLLDDPPWPGFGPVAADGWERLKGT